MSNYLRGTPEQRLSRLSRAAETGTCINFTGYLNEDGYGRFHLDGKKELSHRASWRIFRGEIPEDRQVLHECDNPSCVNPNHLFLGTHDDNMKDMAKKGRGDGAKGISHHFAKLNPEKAFEIRWYAAMGRKHKDIAAEYGITRSLVGCVTRCEIWKPECHD